MKSWLVVGLRGTSIGIPQCTDGIVDELIEAQLNENF